MKEKASAAGENTARRRVVRGERGEWVELRGQSSQGPVSQRITGRDEDSTLAE